MGGKFKCCFRYLSTVSSRVPRCVARHCARNVRGVAWELEFSRVV